MDRWMHGWMDRPDKTRWFQLPTPGCGLWSTGPSAVAFMVAKQHPRFGQNNWLLSQTVPTEIYVSELLYYTGMLLLFFQMDWWIDVRRCSMFIWRRIHPYTFCSKSVQLYLMFSFFFVGCCIKVLTWTQETYVEFAGKYCNHESTQGDFTTTRACQDDASRELT